MSQPQSPIEPPPPATRIHEELGRALDEVPPEPVDLHHSQHAAVLTSLEEAERAGDASYRRELLWELAALRIHVPPPCDGEAKPVEIYQPDAYAFGADSADYLVRRFKETGNPGLRIRYAEILFATGPSKGRDWIASLRRLIDAYQAYVAHTRRTVTPANVGFMGLYIESSVERVMMLARIRGVVGKPEQAELARWVVETAQFLFDFAWKDDSSHHEAGFHQHRYIFAVLDTLETLPPPAIDQQARDRALRLMAAAFAHFANEPLSEHFTMTIAEIEARLRKHFGEPDTHVQKIRRQYDALLRRVALHEKTDSGMLTAHFLREATKLATDHQQLFTEPELMELRERERRAWEQAVAAGEFKTISASHEVDPDDYDLSDATPEGTVEQLIIAAVGLIPEPSDLQQVAARMAEQAPLASLFPRSSIRRGKVVGESLTDDEKRDAELLWLTWLHLSNDVRLYFDVTLRRSVERQGLTPSTLVDAMSILDIDAGTREMLEHGYERYFAGDLVSACHVLVPRVEDILRCELRRMGIESTQFQRGVDGGASRTDDATFGALLFRSTSDGRSVETLLGTPLFTYVRLMFNLPAGPNYRNEFAHGLTRPVDCNPVTIAAVTQVILCLVVLARQRRSDSEEAGGVSRD